MIPAAEFPAIPESAAKIASEQRCAILVHSAKDIGPSSTFGTQSATVKRGVRSCLILARFSSAYVKSALSFLFTVEIWVGLFLLLTVGIRFDLFSCS